LASYYYPKREALTEANPVNIKSTIVAIIIAAFAGPVFAMTAYLVNERRGTPGDGNAAWVCTYERGGGGDNAARFEVYLSSEHSRCPQTIEVK
jgi:hypothetical protein